METPFPPFEPHGEKRRLRSRIKWIPIRILLPNLITVLAICAGLSGVRLAFENRFEIAVIMVLFAAFLDGIDGRIARMLKATSKFGAEMDSLADIVNFGAVPAMVLYAYMLDRAGNFGWIAALLFAIACALGLEANIFTGYAASVYTVVIAILLVSTLPVYSGKSIGVRVRGDIVVPLMLLVVLYVLLLVSFPWQTMTVSAIAYIGFLPFSYRMYANRLLAERRAADVAAVKPRDEGAKEK